MTTNLSNVIKLRNDNYDSLTFNVNGSFLLGDFFAFFDDFLKKRLDKVSKICGVAT